jgi:putative restriction endonuclease
LSDAQPNALIAIIATRWFSDKASQIQKLFGISPLQTTYSKLENSRPLPLTAEQINDELYDLNRKDIEEIVRDATFRKSIIALYDYKCAFCKLRIVSIKDENIVDGSHIKPFAKFKDDSYTNGISLCKNHHWAFDHGWFGIGDDYEIIIPHNRFDEEPPEDSKRMMDYHKQPISLPNQEDFYPRSEALQWHRNFWKIA